MGHAYELPQEALLDVTPEQAWQAIATGPGIDSWFMGRTDIDGEVVRTVFGGMELTSTVTAAEPLKRFAHAEPTGQDGRMLAYEFLVEARGQGSTLVRMVTSGFLPGDDWEDEFEAMTNGLGLFFATLVEYLTHFAGRTALPVTEFGPQVSDWGRAWQVLRSEVGDGRFTVEGIGPIDGEVFFVNAQTLGIRTPDALYRFIQGLGGMMIVSHHLFSPTPEQGTAWRTWLSRTLQP
ncbi:SRPBCC domain-containing protein [Nonomuraea sp. NPDC050536]|uniref:SRPBCC domain-containing protein n=1 Tax=Nonomuraea sp. NPDC050536 TaxID=3364366 RepID=UPI0037CCB3A0